MKKKRANQFVELELNPADVFLLYPSHRSLLTGHGSDPRFVWEEKLILYVALGLFMFSVGMYGVAFVSTLMPVLIVNMGSGINGKVLVRHSDAGYFGTGRYNAGDLVPPVFEVSYQYIVNGNKYTAQQPVDESYFDSHLQGDVASIQYLPFFPTQSTLVGATNPETTAVYVANFVIATIPWFLITLVVGWFARFTNRRIEELATDFSDARFFVGEITRCIGSKIDGRRQPKYYTVLVTCRFLPSNTEKPIEISQSADRGDLRGKPLPKPGTSVIIAHFDSPIRFDFKTYQYFVM